MQELQQPSELNALQLKKTHANGENMIKWILTWLYLCFKGGKKYLLSFLYSEILFCFFCSNVSFFFICLCFVCSNVLSFVAVCSAVRVLSIVPLFFVPKMLWHITLRYHKHSSQGLIRIHNSFKSCCFIFRLQPAVNISLVNLQIIKSINWLFCL